MLLTPANVCAYLIARGLVTAESVVDGAFLAIDVSRRNRNVKIVRDGRPGYFIKQIQHWDPQAVAMLQCEAACYWLARQRPDLAAFAAMMPEFESYDLERHVLVTALLPGSENLYEHFRGLQQFEPAVGRALGRLLGACHREAPRVADAASALAIFPRQVPWILAVERRNAHPFKALSPATSDLFDALDRRPATGRALDALRHRWRADALIHGDLRFENCVVTRHADATPAVRIVDWEMADIGDRRWDVGGLLQAYWGFAVMSPAAAGGGAGPFDARLPHARRDVAVALREFWDEYVRAAGIDSSAADRVLAECVEFAAARLIQTAYEHVQFSTEVSAAGNLLLELSASLLEDPGGALTALSDTHA